VLVPRAAVDFSERCPDVELDVRIADTEEIVAALKGQEVEVAVLGRDVDDPGLQSTVLEQDELVLVVAASSELAGSELHPNDLAGLPFVMREEGSATRRAATAKRKTNSQGAIIARSPPYRSLPSITRPFFLHQSGEEVTRAKVACELLRTPSELLALVQRG
jgi:DNA-binding transcriptional LysR family regulator